MKTVFTHSERTEKKYTIGLAVEQARSVLKANNPNIGVCLNRVGMNYNPQSPATLEEVSDIAATIIDDSYFYHY